MSTDKNTDTGYDLGHLTLDISSEVLDNAFTFNLVSDGCFGQVYFVPHDGVMYAAKYRCFDKTYTVETFKQECLLHSKLHHPNIVNILGVCYHGNDLNHPIKLMELMKLHLASALYKYEMPMYVKLEILQDVGRGLDYLHTRNPPIIHSYLTMEVILLTAHLVAKIGGFTFSIEMVSEVKRLLEPKAGNEMQKSSLYCGPPFDICSFGWIICKVAIGSHWPPVHMHTVSYIDSIQVPLILHTINVGQYEYYINLVEDVSLKQLVKDCMNDNPGLRPSASLIKGLIVNMIKGEFGICIQQFFPLLHLR